MKTRLGLDRIDEFGSLFKDKRLGLITNYSGVDSLLRENIQILLAQGHSLCKLFAPEHGLYGIADGETVEDMIHPVYQLPVISLYGPKKKPPKEDIEDLDALVYDIQDVGLRYYTFLYTLSYTLETAAECGKEVIVLDRPNPLGGMHIKGPRITRALSSFVGDDSLPIRYGLTIGEYAHYVKSLKKLDVELTVVPMEHYARKDLYPDTGLLWNIPSPALPTFHSVLCYNGGCFFEATNISEGRGTPVPFQFFGAPWIDGYKVYARMQDHNFDKVAFRNRSFVPFSSKHKGEVCFGIEFLPLCKELDFAPIAILLLKTIYQTHPEQFQYTTYADVTHIDRLTGDPRVRLVIEGGMELEELMSLWAEEEKAFAQEVEGFRIY